MKLFFTLSALNLSMRVELITLCSSAVSGHVRADQIILKF